MGAIPMSPQIAEGLAVVAALRMRGELELRNPPRSGSCQGQNLSLRFRVSP
jgi:hypothetical protein